MGTCQNCGAQLLAGSKFCGKCGTSADEPAKRICSKCSSEGAEGLFCSTCGERFVPLAMEGPDGNTQARILTVYRESQFQCVANTYKVIVNGAALGNVGAGGTIRANVTSDRATVDIICTTIMISAQRRLVLKLGANPRISFKVQWPGAIVETVTDAEVLEKR